MPRQCTSPVDYYGNTFAISVAFTTVEKLFENSLDYALEPVRKAKNNEDQEYMQPVADLMAIRGQPLL